MHFDGVSGIEELKGKTVGIFLLPLGKSADSIPAEVVFTDGKWCVDCLPIKKGKYVWQIPDDSFVSAAKDAKSPYRFAIFIKEESGTGLLIRDAVTKAAISRN